MVNMKISVKIIMLRSLKIIFLHFFFRWMNKMGLAAIDYKCGRDLTDSLKASGSDTESQNGELYLNGFNLFLFIPHSYIGGHWCSG